MIRIIAPFVPAKFFGAKKRKAHKRRRRLQYEALETRAMFAFVQASKGDSTDDSSSATIAVPTATSSSQTSSTLVNTHDIDLAIQAGLTHLQNVLDRDNYNLPFFMVWALTKNQAQSYGDSSPYRDSPAHMAFDRHLVSNATGRALYSLMLGSDVLGTQINPQVLGTLQSTILKMLHKPRNGNWSDTSAANQMVTGLAADPRSYGSQRFDLTFLFNMGAGMRGALGLATLSDNPTAKLNGYNWSAKDVFETAVYNIRKYYVYGGGAIDGARAYNWEAFRWQLGLSGGDKIAGSVSNDIINNWSNLWRGWSDPFLVYDLVKYYEQTGHQGSLALARELYDNVAYRFPTNPADVPFQWFGHMFEVVGEMSAYSRLALVTGDADLMQRVRVRYEALRGVGFNTTGWVPEYFGRSSDVGEINNTGELIETALNFAEFGWTEYYNDVERFTRGHLLPSQLLDTSWVIPNTNPDNDGERDIPQRVYGAFGFPAPYGHVATKNPSTTGGYHVDITSGAVASLSEIKKATYRYEQGTHRVNLLFDVDNDQIKVVSPYPNGDRVTITTKVSGDVRLRLPTWADRAAVAASLTQQGLQFEFGTDAVVINQPAVGVTFHVTMPLKTVTATDVVNGRAITIVWKGDSVLGMSRMGTPLPFFVEASTLPPEPAPNTPPQVQAGADQSAWTGTYVALDGTVTDDQLPTIPGLIVNWSKVSGPGTATFGNSTHIDTTVQFSVAGQYVLRLSASDGQATSFDDITIDVTNAANAVTLSFQNGVFPNVNYSGTRDTHVQSGAANVGNQGTLVLDGSPDIAALMAWDIGAIPVGSQVLAAAIQLNVLNPTTSEYEVFALERAWDELAATWENATATGNWAGPGVSGQGDHSAASLAQLAPRTNGVYTMPLGAAGLTLVQQWINDPLANFGLIFKDFTSAVDDVILSSSEATNQALRPRLIVTYEAPPDPLPGDNTPPVNLPPQVSAGPDQSIQLPMAATLTGNVTDDGLPSGSTVARQWTKVSGPGDVTFSNAASASTTAEFSEAGTYVLRLTASDGSLQAFDEITVTVIPPLVHHTPPTVSAGPDQTVQLPNGAVLNGIITLGANPSPTLEPKWTLTTGPGPVTFANDTSPQTTVQFSNPGTYVLRLTGFDGYVHAYDEVTIVVLAPTTPPTVFAGPDQTVQLPNGAVLNGVITLGSNPSPILEPKWTLTTGPGPVTFANDTSPQTTVQFSNVGTYVLRLTAFDGQVHAYDEVTIVVQAPPSPTDSGWYKVRTKVGYRRR